VLAELKRASAIASGDPSFEEQLRDDELRMIFMCCHPEIARDARVALSLKTVGGLQRARNCQCVPADDAAIASVWYAPSASSATGMSRSTCRAAELDQRLDSALETIYFIFNEGYAAHEARP